MPWFYIGYLFQALSVVFKVAFSREAICYFTWYKTVPTTKKIKCSSKLSSHALNEQIKPSIYICH
jgi:hypothetical protein